MEDEGTYCSGWGYSNSDDEMNDEIEEDNETLISCGLASWIYSNESISKYKLTADNFEENSALITCRFLML